MGFKNEVRKCVDAIGRLPGVVDIDVPQLLDDEWGVVLSLSTCDHGWATLGALRALVTAPTRRALWKSSA